MSQGTYDYDGGSQHHHHVDEDAQHLARVVVRGHRQLRKEGGRKNTKGVGEGRRTDGPGVSMTI